MPRGQKSCPKCNKPCGPRTKQCVCGHVYLISSSPSSKKQAEYEDGNIKPGKAKCSNCSGEYSSEDHSVDNYGTVTYVFKFGNHCSYSCVEHASSKKDSLIIDLLNKIEESNSEELKSFVEIKEEDSEAGPLIEDIFLRADSVKEEEEYRRTHPEIVLTSNPRKRNAPTSIEECEEAGIKVPPKIGDFIPKEPEIEMNPLKAALRGIKLPSPMVESEDDEDEDYSDGSDDEDLNDESPIPLKDDVPSKPLTIAEKFAQFKTKTIAPTTVSAPVSNQKPSTSYDSISKPTQGQKKCGAKDRAKGLLVGCGKILGVRVKQCPCGYTFP